MISKNFIIFSSIDWSTHWQIHHQLVKSIVESGGRVLYIENTGVRSPKIKDFGRIVDRIKSRLNSTHGFKDVEEFVTVFSPVFAPYPYNKLSILLNTILASNSINKWVRAANFIDPICISFLPTPAIQGTIKSIHPSLTIYYCADDMSRSLDKPNLLNKYESIFFKNVDLVYTTAHSLYDKASKFNNFVFNVPAGIDSSVFPPRNSLTIPRDIAKISKPIIGYIGAISDVFDKELIIDLSKSIPNANIVLVGPEYTDVAMLENIDNVYLLGEKSHNLMPNYINSFDIALIPYIVNDATDSVYSCKLNEYLSLGKPILSTNLNEVKIFNQKNNGLVAIGEGAKDFVYKAIELLKTLSQDSQEIKNIRINTAKENTWNERFLIIEDTINNRLKSKINNKVDWKNTLIVKYKKSKYLFFYKLSVFATLYFLIFYSPLFWLMGEYLNVGGHAEKSDAIIVFSGDGKASYQNLSYQDRALEAVKLFHSGYSDKIFLSSGREQAIADVEMIKLYLISRGVPSSSINMLEKYPGSTHQNVMMVKESLEKNNIKSILFVTAPYHSRRAVLTWGKNAPNIEVISFNTTNPLNRDVQWNLDLDKIRIIVYEYAAIVHNWVVGRI